MAYTTIFGTGFEMGSRSLIPDAGIIGTSYLNTDTNYIKTGNYSFQIRGAGGQYKIPVDDLTEVYVAVWFHPHDYFNSSTVTTGLIFHNGTTEIASVRYNDTNKRFDLYIAGSLSQVGSFTVTNNEFMHLQFRLLIDNTTGYAEVRVNGTTDSSYTGNTGTNPINYVTIWADRSFSDSYWDDISIGTGGWPGDRRFESLVPNGDDTLEWDTTGANGYSVIDERPANTSDYIYTTVSGEQAIFDLASWSYTNKSIKAVHAWAYARETAAESSQISVGIVASGIEDKEAHVVNTNYTYYNHISNENPSTSSPWENTEIEGLLVLVEKAN